MVIRAEKRTRRTISGNHGQDWESYNLSQTNEKTWFPQILRMLCDCVVDPITTGPGRPSISYGDRVFCVVMKTFESDSARRSTGDLVIAAERKFLKHVPHFNSVLNYTRDEQLSEIIEQLVARSSFPLRKHEKGIAVDSSSFSTEQYRQWSKVKFGKAEEWHDWRKLHVAVGVDSHIITAVQTSDAYANDYNFLRPLLLTTKATGYEELIEVYADKAYLGGENIRLIGLLRLRPYILPKARTSAEGKSQVWKDMYEEHETDPEGFGSHYHLRSNAETVFSMIKAIFGGALYSKSKAGQRTELLAKALCHNIRVLIKCKYEFGLKLDFLGDPLVLEQSSGQLTLPNLGITNNRIIYVPGLNRK